MNLIESLKQIVPLPSMNDFRLNLGTNISDSYMLLTMLKDMNKNKVLKDIHFSPKSIHIYTTKDGIVIVNYDSGIYTVDNKTYDNVKECITHIIGKYVK